MTPARCVDLHAPYLVRAVEALVADHPGRTRETMGVDDPLGRLAAVPGRSAQEREAIRGANAARLLKLDAS